MRKFKKPKIKNDKILKIFKFSVLIFLGLLIIGFFYSVISNQIVQLKRLEFLREDINQFNEADKSSGYSRTKPYTLLLMVDYDGGSKDQVDGFIVLQLNYQSKSATVVSIHPDVYINSTVYNIDPEASSLVRVKDLFVVGELITPPKPCSYAVYSIEELLAIHIDGYVWVKSEELEEFLAMGGKSIQTDFFEEDRDYEDWSIDWNNFWIDYFDSVSLWKVWKNRGVISNISSNMDVVSTFNVFQDFGSVKSDHIYSVTVSKDHLAKQTNNKGDVVDVATQSAIDKSLNGYLADITVDREQARIEIFNGSQVDGLGSRYERWIEHLGADVIRVQNAPGIWDDTTIYVTDLDEFSYTLDKIVSLWGDEIKVVEKRPDFITTGDIIIVLGLDFLNH